MIRFRVWDKDEKQMYSYEKAYSGDHIDYNMIEWIDDAVVSHMHGESSDEWAEQTEVMRFTNILDVDGNPIYENDFVEFYFDKLNGWRRYLVVWEGWYFKFKDAGVWGLNHIFPIDYRKTRVVGNLFENPELKKQCGRLNE